jgi:acyl-CoA synthetase (AMP-forming)/AMP-acid ligase II
MHPETGAPVPSGTRGELWVRGYSVMQGYYKPLNLSLFVAAQNRAK